MLIGGSAWLCSAFFAAVAYRWLVRKYSSSFKALNYKGLNIPASAGIIVVLACLTAYECLLVCGSAAWGSMLRTALGVVILFGLLGLADDLYGDRGAGGLRGHFVQLFRHRKLTTGAAKAIGGGIVSLAAGFYLHREHPLTALAAALIIALSANAMNLTDTRPGRSLAACLAFSVIPVALGLHHINDSIYLTFAPPLAIACVLFLYDRRALLMIGDVGANALGAMVGLIWATIAPESAQIVFLLLLLWFHWWTESHSLSLTIERTAWLRKIDSNIGIRG